MIRLHAVLTTPLRSLCLAAALALPGCATAAAPTRALSAAPDSPPSPVRNEAPPTLRNDTSPVVQSDARPAVPRSVSARVEDPPPGAQPFPPADLGFALPDGTVLPARRWLPPPGTPLRRIVLALHGFNDSRDAWELPAPTLAAAGIATFAPDQRGFGASPTRGRWPGSQALVDDAAAMAGQLHARYPALPLTVMGESMGGAITLLLAAGAATPISATPSPASFAQPDATSPAATSPGVTSPGVTSPGVTSPAATIASPAIASPGPALHAPSRAVGLAIDPASSNLAADAATGAAGVAGAIDSYVLLAPAVWDRAEMGPLLTASLWVAAGLAPGHVVTGSELPLRIAASDNRAALLRLFHDPLTLRGTRLDVLRGLVGTMDRAAAAAPHVHGRVLVLDGGRDQLVPPAATAATWAALPATVRRGFYPGGYHLLLRDRDRGLPTADIIAWLDDPQAWLPSGADAAAGAWTASRAWADEPTPWLPATADALAGADRP